MSVLLLALLVGLVEIIVLVLTVVVLTRFCGLLATRIVIMLKNIRTGFWKAKNG